MAGLTFLFLKMPCYLSAPTCGKNPELKYHLFAGVFGAYFSDLICYWLAELRPKSGR